MKLVNTIIANTKGDGEKSGEDFWVKAEKLYYTALIGYIWYEAPEDEKNFTKRTPCYASYSLPASLKKTSGSTAEHRKERLKQSHLSIPAT